MITNSDDDAFTAIKYLDDHCILGRISGYVFDRFSGITYAPSSVSFWNKYPIIRIMDSGFRKNTNLGFTTNLHDIDVSDGYPENSNINMSYLFTAITDKKETDQATKNLKLLATQVANINLSNDWYGRIITIPYLSLAIISVFITNCQIPQIVGIGDDLIYVIRDAQYQIQNFDVKPFRQEVFDTLAPLTFLYKPVPLIKFYKKQLIGINTTTAEINNLSDHLARIASKYIKQIENEMHTKYYNKGNGKTAVIVPLKLNNIYTWYQFDHPKKTIIKKENDVKTDSDYKELIKYLRK